MDDSLFNLWREGKCAKTEVLIKAHMPDELNLRITKAERGNFRGRGRRPASEGKDNATLTDKAGRVIAISTRRTAKLRAIACQVRLFQ